MPTINLRTEVKQRLTNAKDELGFTAYNDVVNHLIILYEKNKKEEAEKIGG